MKNLILFLGFMALFGGCSTTHYHDDRKDSDRRVKNSIVDLPNSLTSIRSLRPRQYFLNSNSVDVQAGFIAQEFFSVFPQYTFVNGDDGVSPLGSNFPWQISMQSIMPHMVGAIQQIDANTTDFGTKVSASLSAIPAAASGVAKNLGVLTLPAAGRYMVYLKCAIISQGLTITMTQSDCSISPTTNTHLATSRVRETYATLLGTSRNSAANPYYIDIAAATTLYGVFSAVWTGTAPPITVPSDSEFYAVRIGAH